MPRNHHPHALLLGVLFLAIATTAAPKVSLAGPPNVVFIMADDVGLGDVGFYHRERTGQPAVVETPNLDALAAAGMRFSDAHSSTALCSPTRYCAMSGNHNYRCYAPWGVWGTYRPTPFSDRDATLGRIAKRAGLRTAFIGKWHLGGDYLREDGKGVFRGNDHSEKPIPVDVSRIVSGGPQSLGFDDSFTLPCGVQGPMYTAYENGEWSPFAADSRLIHFTAKTAGDPAYVSDKGPGMGDSRWDTSRVGPLLADKAERFIDQSARAGEPFFLCYWPSAVHLPHLPPEEFDGRKVRGQTPSRHLDMVIDLDQQVGRIINTLKRAGVYRNTLLIFSSDNGGLIDRQGEERGHDSSGGYRGSKNFAHEGGHRVPFFACWPDRIAAGAKSDAMIGVHDVAATMAAALGVGIAGEQAMDSYNLLPLLVGSERFRPRAELLLQAGNQRQGIYRQGPWKLTLQGDEQDAGWEPIALFNLADSPLEPESHNLVAAPEHQDRVAAMRRRYLQLRASSERTTPPVEPRPQPRAPAAG